MLASLLDTLVNVIVSLLAFKLFFGRSMNSTEVTSQQKEREGVSWKSAVETMTVMEARLQQLQERDMKHQERIWTLEDTNRDLQDRLSRATKELLRLRPAAASDPLDDDDFDAANSIPPSS